MSVSVQQPAQESGGGRDRRELRALTPSSGCARAIDGHPPLWARAERFLDTATPDTDQAHVLLRLDPLEAGGLVSVIEQQGPQLAHVRIGVVASVSRFGGDAQPAGRAGESCGYMRHLPPDVTGGRSHCHGSEWGATPRRGWR